MFYDYAAPKSEPNPWVIEISERILTGYVAEIKLQSLC